MSCYEDLIKALFTAVEYAIGNETTLAVAFSGGLDSSLLAKICKDIGVDVTLLTVGFSESFDISFSKDIASKMNLPHKVLELDMNSLKKMQIRYSTKLNATLPHILKIVLDFSILVDLLMLSGFRTVLTANGCDELFCGYDRFRLAYTQGSQDPYEAYG